MEIQRATGRGGGTGDIGSAASGSEIGADWATLPTGTINFRAPLFVPGFPMVGQRATGMLVHSFNPQP